MPPVPQPQPGASPPPRTARRPGSPAQMQQGDGAAPPRFPPRQEQHRGAWPATGAPDSHARLHGQQPRRVDDEARLQQQQAGSSQDL